MVRSVEDFADLKSPKDQLSAMFEIFRQAPELSPELAAVDPQLLEQLETFFSLDPRLLRRIGGREVEELLQHMGSLKRLWADEMPKAMEGIRASVGGSELNEAIGAGAVEVAD